MKTSVYCFGTLSERYWRDAFAEYEKRLLPLWPLSVTERPEARVPQNPSDAQIEAALAAEARDMLPRLPARAFVVALCVEGKPLTSPELSRKMEEAALRGASEVAFLIGSSHGLHPTLKARADLRLSLSAMTLPHQLARVMLAEQIYRAAMIARGTGYHK